MKQLKERHYWGSFEVLNGYFNNMPYGELVKIAKKIDIPYNTLRDWVILGTTACPASIIGELYNITKYKPFLTTLTPAGCEIVEQNEEVKQRKKTLEGETIVDISNSARIIEIWYENLTYDGRVTNDGKAKTIAALIKKEQDAKATRMCVECIPVGSKCR